MSKEDEGISYKMEGPGQDILLNALPYAVKNRLHSQAYAVETQRSASCKHSYHFLPLRYTQGARPYHERLLGTPDRMRDQPGIRGILAARTEGGRETRSETVRPQESGLWLSKVFQEPNYSRCLVDPGRTRAPLQVTERGCEG